MNPFMNASLTCSAVPFRTTRAMDEKARCYGACPHAPSPIRLLGLSLAARLPLSMAARSSLPRMGRLSVRSSRMYSLVHYLHMGNVALRM